MTTPNDVIFLTLLRVDPARVERMFAGELQQRVRTVRCRANRLGADISGRHAGTVRRQGALRTDAARLGVGIRITSSIL